jgi:PleD family two-component response regulator
VALPGASAAVAAQKAEDLRARVEALAVRYLEGNLPKITICIGVAVFPDSGDNPQAVLKAADEALYRAKEAGRNRVEVAPPINAPAAMQSELAASFASTERKRDRRIPNVVDAA